MPEKMTTAEFIRKSIEIHGTEKYDYSETEYKSSVDKVKIYCNTCKEFFWQKPTAHCSTGSGCKKCGLKKTHDSSRKSTEDFVSRAIKAKGIDVYDYSMTRYVDSKTKLKIRCIKHDLVFEVAPHDFLRPNRGCPLCGKEKMSASNLMSQDDFIAKEREAHPEYDYSLVVYKTCRDKITVICPVHKEFQIRPDQLLQGQSCRKCAIEKRNRENKRRLNTNIFIERSRMVHGDLYNYDSVEYDVSRTPVLIGCKIHGNFLQVPSQHLLGAGCRKCADTSTGLLNKLTTDEWISRAVDVHGDKYSYEESEYKGCSFPIKVRCKEHGIFTIDPSAHTRGSGCSSCATKGFDKNKDAVLYVLKIDGIINFTGFGITCDPPARTKAHAVNLRLNGCFIDEQFISSVEPGTDILQLETILKQTFPLATCSKDISGFKTESTTTPYNEVVDFVRQYIENNNKEPYGDN